MGGDGDFGYSGFSMGGSNVVSGSDWTNIIIPGEVGAIGGLSEFHHERSFLLTDLLGDSQYECLVQAKNRFGWSEASRIHRFATQSATGKKKTH